MFRALCFYTALMLCCKYLQAANTSAEQMLITWVFKDYQKQARPVFDASTPIYLTVGMELVQLVSVDDRNQFITTKAWIRQKWKNMLLTWEPSQWNNITTFQVENDKVWLPDTVLYNNGDDKFTGGPEKFKTRVMLHYNGMNIWNAPATFTSTCKIDIRYFPFDRQECSLKFGSWTFDKRGITLLLDNKSVITNQFINSSEWDITKTVVKLNEKKYTCCPTPYMDVTIVVTLLRKPLYYVFNVILPCIVLVTTILFGFFLPPESGERISLTITILLAVAVFLQLVSDALPRNSDSIPVLGIFYMVVMGESAFSLITTCLVLIVHYKSTDKLVKPMPQWMRSIFLKRIAKYLGMGGACAETESDNSEGYDEAPRSDTVKFVSNRNKNLRHRAQENDHSRNNFNGKAQNQIMAEKIQMREAAVDKNDFSNTMDAILHEVQTITSSIKYKQKQGETEEEWKFLAKVLDRIFFWIFLITVILSAICILVPGYVKYHH